MSSKNPKNILVVNDTLLFGGAETFTMRMARYYREDGHKVALVSIKGDQVNYDLVRENAGDTPLLSFNPAPVINWLLYKIDGLLARLQLFNGLRRWLTIRKFKKILVARAIDVVHTNMFASLDVFSHAAADIPGITLIHSVHSDLVDMAYREITHDFGHGSRYDWHCIRHRVPHMVKRVNHVVCTAEMQLKIFAAWNKIGPYKLHKIYNPVDVRKDSGAALSRGDLQISENAFLFGSMARCIKEKGWEELILAFIQAGLPDAYLMLIGGGPMLEYLKITYGAHANILFLGAQPAPHKYLKLMDAGVSSSWFWESLPTAIIDYLSISAPVICTDNGDSRYMIQSAAGPAGIVVPLQKDEWEVIKGSNPLKVNDMAAALRKMYEEQFLREQFKNNAKACFRMFDKKEIVEKYEKLFEEKDPGPEGNR